MVRLTVELMYNQGVVHNFQLGGTSVHILQYTEDVRI